MYSEDILKSALFECPPLRTYSCGAPHRLDLNLENNKKGRGDPSCLVLDRTPAAWSQL